MKPPIFKLPKLAAFTLVELLIASAVGSLVLGGLMTGSMALQRAFVASEQHAVAEADLLRVADYVARDIRCATSITTAVTAPVLLTLTTGDVYDRRGTPGNTADDIPNSPVLTRTGVSYGTSPVTIRYLKSGTRISREVSQTDADVTTVTSTWIGDNLDTLTFTRDAAGVVTISAEYAMRFSVRTGGATAPKRTLTMLVYPRIAVP